MPRLWKNNANSLLALAIGSSDTTITVSPGTGNVFPVVSSPDYCLLTLTDTSSSVEIIKVVSRTVNSDTMTVIRGQEGTSPRSWPVGTVVSLRLTASALTDYEFHIHSNFTAHAASVISNTPSGWVTAVNVQGAINQLASAINNKQSVNSVLTALTALTPTADTLPYFTTTTTASVTPLTSFARTLLDDSDAATARNTLGAQEALISGTNIKTINGMSLLGSGDISITGTDNGFKNLRIYTTSNTWTKPSGIKRVKVIVIGGGGGGTGGYSVGTSNFGGNGGGGGGTAIKVIEESALAATEAIIVGVGGAGGVGSANGTNGGTSAFGSHCFATGGNGANASANTYAVGGQGVGGDLNLIGEHGGFGIYGPIDGGSVYAIGGKGGRSLLGSGGLGMSLAFNGLNGEYGGGGGGGGRTGNGGNGGSGLVLVEEYF